MGVILSLYKELRNKRPNTCTCMCYFFFFLKASHVLRENISFVWSQVFSLYVESTFLEFVPAYICRSVKRVKPVMLRVQNLFTCNNPQE